MTSKKALERIIQSHYVAMSCLGIEKPDIETENAIEQIEQDLAVLEILRKNLDLEIIDVCKTYGIYKVHIANLYQELTIDENEFKLVKEWLENDIY